MGQPGASTFIVVAAYNEGSVLRDTLAPLFRQGYSVVVVDDGSSDDTWTVLRSLPVHALRHPINLGQGAALQTGMDYALKHGAEFVVHFDADGQHPHDQIEEMLAPIRAGQADVVLGCRFLRDEDRRHVPLVKRVVLRAGALVSALMTGVWLKDSHNGFRALSADAVSRIRLTENGFAHATEILRQIRLAGLRYVEIPTTIRYSEYSRAKGQPVTNAFNIVMDLILGRLFR